MHGNMRPGFLIKQDKMYIRPIMLFLGISSLCLTQTAWAQKPDTAQISYRRPLFEFKPIQRTFALDKQQSVNKSGFLRYSLLSSYREGVAQLNNNGFTNFMAVADKNNGTRTLYMYNLSIQDMLTYGFYQSNKVVLEVKDASRYRYDVSQGSKREWMRKNAHCFELTLPIEKFQTQDLILNELSRIFGVTCGMKKRLVNALVLVRISSQDKLRSKGTGAPSYDITGHFNNISIAGDRFGDHLYKAGMPPVVDETGYKDPVDMELNISDWKNLAEVKKALNRYDLDLKEEKREVLMFVITELDKK